MVVAQGDVFWADLPLPAGSEAGYRRPVVVVQGDAFNRSAIRTVVCIPLSARRMAQILAGVDVVLGR